MNLGQLIRPEWVWEVLRERSPVGTVRLADCPRRTICRDPDVAARVTAVPKVKNGRTQRIREFLATLTEPATFDQVCEGTGDADDLKYRSGVQTSMHELVKRGQVTRVGPRGQPLYTITPRGRRVSDAG